MALGTLNGIDIVSAIITMPRVGVWSANLILDTPGATPTGRVTIAFDGGLTLSGTVQRGGSWQETGYVRVMAGAGGLPTITAPRAYTSTIVGSVLRDLLAVAGETLSPTADQGVLLTQLPNGWTVARRTTAMAVGNLVGRGAPAATWWRALADGTLWVGPETWPDSGLVDGIDFQDIDENPIDVTMEMGVETPRLLPGTLVGGRKVDWLEHRIGPKSVRTFVMFVRKLVDGTDAA